MATYDGTYYILEGRSAKERPKRSARLKRRAREGLRALADPPRKLAGRLGKLARDDFTRTADDLRRFAGRSRALADRVEKLARDDCSRTADDLKRLGRLSLALARRLEELARDDLSRTANDLVRLAARSRAFGDRVGNLARDDFRETTDDLRSLAGLTRSVAARGRTAARQDLSRTAEDARRLADLSKALAKRLTVAAGHLMARAGHQLSTLARHLERQARRLKGRARNQLRILTGSLRSLAALPGELLDLSGQAAARARARIADESRTLARRIERAAALVKSAGGYHLRRIGGLSRHRYGELAAYLEHRSGERRKLAEQRARLERVERKTRREIAQEEARQMMVKQQARQEQAEEQARSRLAERAKREAERQAQLWLAEQARQEAQQVKLRLAEQARREAEQAKLRLAEESRLRIAERQKVATAQERAALEPRRLAVEEKNADRSQRRSQRGRRVLILVENLPSPFDRRVWQEATALRDAGCLVSIVCPTGKGYEKKFEDIDGIHIWRYDLPFEANGALGYLAEYATALASMWMLSWRVYFGRGFDAIHACNPPDLLFLIGGFFKLLGKKFLFDHHDINPELYEAKFGRRDFFYRLLVRFERWSFGAADVSIATNESYRKIAIERGGMRPDRVFVVRSGPSLERMKIVPPDERLKRGRRYLVGYVGVMGKQEGIDSLLRAVRLIVSRHGRTDIHFGLVGGGTSLDEMKALAERLEIADYVTFTGRVPDAEMLAMLNTADVCVNPDVPNEMNDKSTMNKIMEYMALGKPIVQFDLTEGRYSARAAALNARRDDIADFAARILELVDNPELRSRMGAFGRERVLNELSWDHEAPKLLAAYERLWASEKKAGLLSPGTADAMSALTAPPGPPAAAS